MANYDDGLGPVTTALAHPARRRMVHRLGESDATSSELSELTGVGLPTVAKHVATLGAAGLITSSKAGRVVTHRLRPAGFEEFAAWIATRTSFWNHQFDALTHHLEDL